MNGNNASGGGLTTEALVHCTGEIVSQYVRGNHIRRDEVPDLIQTVGRTLAGLSTEEVAASSSAQKPAVPISRSVMPDYVVCLEDGARLKMMKRYLRCRFGLSPEEYRRKWKLPPEYPMVAPNYAKRRSDFAKAAGLGKTVRRR